MSPQQFIDIVCRMRTAQEKYFRTDRFDDFLESSKLEREVDLALRDFLNPKDQISIFPLPASQ